MTAPGRGPNEPFKPVFSSQKGAVGPCAGAVSGLGALNLRLRANLTADAAGEASLRVTLPAPACASSIQAIDVGSCTFTGVVQP